MPEYTINKFEIQSWPIIMASQPGQELGKKVRAGASVDSYFQGLLLQLIRSYLTNRLQYTFVNGTKSNLSKVKCGVPQGSTLGPSLFLIYVNDLPNISNLITTLFASDTVLTMTNSSIMTLQHRANKELMKIDEWLRLNKLSLNYSKT